MLDMLKLDFPGGASGKEPTCQWRGHKRFRLDPWVGRSPRGGHGNPLQYSSRENPMGRRACCKELDTKVSWHAHLNWKWAYWFIYLQNANHSQAWQWYYFWLIWELLEEFSPLSPIQVGRDRSALCSWTHQPAVCFSRVLVTVSFTSDQLAFDCFVGHFYGIYGGGFEKNTFLIT